MFDIEEGRKRVLQFANELREDIETLYKIINDMETDLEAVMTEDDAVAFDEKWSDCFDERLKHIAIQG